MNQGVKFQSTEPIMGAVTQWTATMMQRLLQTSFMRFSGGLLQLVVLLLAGSMIFTASALEIPSSSISEGTHGGRQQTELFRLVRYVEMGSAQERLDFAHYAIVQMAMEHEQALAVAVHEQPGTLKKLAKQRRWIAATQRYLEQLATTLDAVGLAADVPVFARSAGEPTIVVDGRPLLVSSMDMKSPEKLGEGIVAAFCRLRRCDFLQAPAAPSVQVDTSAPSTRIGTVPRWSFGDGAYAVLRTGAGLNFMFADVTERVTKERICMALSEELQTLSDRLIDAEAAGYVVEWSRVRIVDEDGRQKVYVDGQDNFVRMQLPLLSRAESVLRVASPWLAARMRGESVIQYVPSADLLLKQVLTEHTAGVGL